MRKITFVLLALALAMAIFSQSACYYDNEEELYGATTTCDTANVKYSTYVSKLVSDNCLSCHIAGGAQETSPLDGFTNLKTYATNGKFMARINDTGSPMPPSGLLSTCDRSKIEAWIKAGATNN
jgi:hypothetical protein